MVTQTKNDIAWELLFEKYGILERLNSDGRYSITADQINEFRQARLMTKFDHKVNLPSIFTENNLSILPITRGKYVISTFEAYHQLPVPSGKVEKISLPSHIESLSPKALVSEAIALNCMNASGTLEDFLEDQLLVATINGRMGSGEFDFKIDSSRGKQDISVKNSQIEIDAAYEGVEYLSLFEAKMSLADDFLIRQLYYPYRVLNKKIRKQIKPIFLVFSNGIFHLYQYEFLDMNDYNSLSLSKQKNYSIVEQIHESEIRKLVREASIEAEPAEVPFPQADDMARIINLLEFLKEGPADAETIRETYAFDIRQASYYANAGKYLGLIERPSRGMFELSAKGNKVMELSYRNRNLAIVELVLAHKPFRKSLELFFRSGRLPDKAVTVDIMRGSNLCNVSADSTYYRRAGTVISWIKWVLSLTEV